MNYITKKEWKRLIKGKYPEAEAIPVTELKIYIKQPYKDNPPTKYPAFDLDRDGKPAYDNDVIIDLEAIVHSCFYNGQFFCLNTVMDVPGDSGIYDMQSYIVGEYIYWYVDGYYKEKADFVKFSKKQYQNEVKRFLPVWAEFIKNHFDGYYLYDSSSNYEETGELIKIFDAPFEYIKDNYERDRKKLWEIWFRYGIDLGKLIDKMENAIADPEWRRKLNW